MINSHTDRQRNSYSYGIGDTGSVYRMYLSLVVLLLSGVEIGSSTTRPRPVVVKCRDIFKGTDGKVTHNFKEGESCVGSITLPITQNFTDPRDCRNFYRCEGLTCLQCPCGSNTTFNPITRQCDSTNAPCMCRPSSSSTQEPKETTVVTISEPSQTTGREYVISPAHPSDGEDVTGDSSNGVVIIAVIVVATVVILVALILGFCMWQRGIFPLRKKPNIHNPSSNGGYLHTLPPQERHVYAEIDENAVAQELQNRREEEARRQLQHIYAPPIPSNPPPPTCVHHPHQTFILPAGYPQRLAAQFPYNSHSSAESRDLMRFSIGSGESKSNFSQNNNHNGHACPAGEYIADTSSMTSCSGCSHCSGLSNHIIVEGGEMIDRRTLLKPLSHTIPGNHVYI